MSKRWSSICTPYDIVKQKQYYQQNNERALEQRVGYVSCAYHSNKFRRDVAKLKQTNETWDLAD